MIGSIHPHPVIIGFDIETVPDAAQFARACSDTASADAARRACLDGDKELLAELLPEFKPGSASKPETLLSKLEEFLRIEPERLVKRLSVDPTRLAILSWAAYCDGSPERGIDPQGAVCSWGRDEDVDDNTSPLGTIYRRAAVATGDSKPLIEMSTEEQWEAEHAALLSFWLYLGGFGDVLRDPARCGIVATFNGADFDLRALAFRTARHRKPCGDMPGVHPTVRLHTPRYQAHPHLDVAQVMWGWDKSNSRGCGLEESCARLGMQMSKGGMDGSLVYPAACEGRWDEIEHYNLGDAVATTQAARILVDGGAV